MVEQICVLGNTLEGAFKLLDILCEANPGLICYKRRDLAVMADGTELIPMSIQDGTRFAGRRFDYIFYEKGVLGSYCVNYGLAIEYITQYCMMPSVIPDEFRWCAVDTSV